MNQERSRQLAAALNVKRNENASLSRCVRLGLVSTLGAALSICQPDVPVAQQRPREPGVKVRQIAASGGVVSITADGSMNRAQTWQDKEGFHVVLVNGATDLAVGSPRGVKLRRVGDSLEMVVPVRAGASVTVQPKGNRLDLVVSGDGFAGAGDVEREEQSHGATPPPERRQKERAPQDDEGRVASVTAKQRHLPGDTPANETPQPVKRVAASSDLLAMAGAAPQGAQAPNAQPVAAGAGGDAPNPIEQPAPATTPPESGQPSGVPDAAAQLRADDGTRLGSLIFSLPSLLVLLGASAIGALLFILRRRRAASADEEAADTTEVGKLKRVESKSDAAHAEFEQPKGDRRKSIFSVPFERRTHGRGAEDEATRQQAVISSHGSEGGVESRASSPSGPAVSFGSYRNDQEVVKLVHGEPHSVEVLSSRASEDRRAIETSLLKALRAPETDEDGRRRARTALEDYGFVARESASLLLSRESFERATAARTLGEMMSAQALPFLTEALYDGDAVVRTEVVQSLGALGLPSAIGALLDIARRHPELPATILGPALTACSVESLELQWASADESCTFAEAGAEDFFTGEIHMLERVAEVEQLP
ncbi:MAG: HEAT repeat domain-containing protein, partial [Pyrinomonadaceae bacterium]